MSEVKDPKIKLFGKTIELPEKSSSSAAADESGVPCSARSYEHATGDGSNHDPPCSCDSVVENRHLMTGDAEEDESVKPPLSSSHEKHHPKECEKNPKPDEPKDHKPAAVSKTSPKPEEAQPETMGGPNEKALKKPDKILPCPRCNSMDTKFCYFNNYNVNQPRHFCKNCQRYWTAGGTMRNVPVGAGRRKNKSSSTTAAAHFRHLAVPSEILVFGGPDSLLCDSIASSLSITDQTGGSGLRNGLIRPESNLRVPPPPPPPPPQASCFPRLTQWTYHPWGPVGWTPPGGSCSVPFYPTAPPSYWGWSVPCVVPTVGPGPMDSGSNSPTLGKHSREGETAVATKESDPKKCLWSPKTSRIDDPSEAAKSSIWAMLGLQNEGGPDSGKGSIFKAFGTESRGDGKVHVPEASTVLQANPAALSRALSFHESS